jgi:hypothetical protein
MESADLLYYKFPWENESEASKLLLDEKGTLFFITVNVNLFDVAGV